MILDDQIKPLLIPNETIVQIVYMAGEETYQRIGTIQFISESNIGLGFFDGYIEHNTDQINSNLIGKTIIDKIDNIQEVIILGTINELKKSRPMGTSTQINGNKSN